MGESVKTDSQKNSGLTRQELRELESKEKTDTQDCTDCTGRHCHCVHFVPCGSHCPAGDDSAPV